MLSVNYYLISPQQAYIILLAFYCHNCSTFDVLQVPMCTKKTKFKIQNLKFIMCITFNKVGPVKRIPPIKVHLNNGNRRNPSY